MAVPYAKQRQLWDEIEREWLDFVICDECGLVFADPKDFDSKPVKNYYAKHIERDHPELVTDLSKPLSVKPKDLRRGHRYRVIHQIPGVQRFPRASVMDYLGAHDGGKSLSFNARPVAGTQNMARDMVIDIIEVEKGTPISINDDARKLL